MRQVSSLGVLVPARQDGPYATSTARSLLEAADAADIPVSVALVDDGGNGDLAGALPDDPRLLVVTNARHGPGFARTAGARALAERVGQQPRAPGEAWLVSLDADVTLPPTFVSDWTATIETTSADVLVAPAFFGAVGAESTLLADVEAASSWMWGDTSLYERFVGLVNIGGCNHAVSLDVCQANGWYLQPTQLVDGQPAIVPGDDWDFGLRARMAGRTTARVDQPAVTTSVRRIAADPVGFLAGRSYERAFEPIRAAPGSGTGAWPPEEPWDLVARRGRARLVAHFLLKPLLAGIEPAGALEWFLGASLLAELDKLVARAPKWVPGGDWNQYRTRLVEVCFSDDVFDWCARTAQHIAGGDS